MKEINLFNKKFLIDYIPPIEGGISLSCYENLKYMWSIYENKNEVVYVVIRNKKLNNDTKLFYCNNCGCSYESNENLSGIQCHCGGYIIPS